MRDLILFTAILSLLPLCVYRPWIGVLAWSWLGYMNPHRLTWGAAYDFPFAQSVAVATLAGFTWYIIREQSLRRFFDRPELVLLVLLWIVFTYTTMLALSPSDAWESWNQINKILLMVFLTSFLINDERKLRYLLLVITFSIGFYGVKGGVFSVLTGGQYRVWGPPGSFIEDNNALALGINMILPFMYFLAQAEKLRWLRLTLFAMFGVSILAVLFTYSRGGFLGLAIVLLSIFLTTRLRTRILIGIVLLVTFPVMVTQMPDQWKDRMQSISTYEQDGSALSRLEAWKSAWNLALDRPLTGGGFGALNDQDVFFKYNPGILQKMEQLGEMGVHASGVHSIYFELLVENGFPGLILFLVLCVVLFRNHRMLANRGSPETIVTRRAYARLLSVSLLAYLVSGTFLEMVSFDLFYQLVALTAVACRIYLFSDPAPHRDDSSKAMSIPNQGPQQTII